MSKKRSALISALIAFLLLTAYMLTSCGESTPQAVFSYKPEMHIIAQTSLAECVDDADIIIRCRVIDIGAPYLLDGYTLPEVKQVKDFNDETTQADLKANIIGIRTPVTLDIMRTYKGAEHLDGVEFPIDELYGNYRGFELLDSDMTEHLIADNEYLMFIKYTDGVPRVQYQQTLWVNPEDESDYMSLLSNYAIYSPYFDISEICANIEAHRNGQAIPLGMEE